LTGYNEAGTVVPAAAARSVSTQDSRSRRTVSPEIAEQKNKMLDKLTNLSKALTFMSTLFIEGLKNILSFTVKIITDCER